MADSITYESISQLVPSIDHNYPVWVLWRDAEQKIYYKHFKVLSVQAMHRGMPTRETPEYLIDLLTMTLELLKESTRKEDGLNE